MSGSPSARCTTWRSQTFSASVFGVTAGCCQAAAGPSTGSSMMRNRVPYGGTMMDRSKSSPGADVAVLSRAISILDAVEQGAHTFTRVVDATGLPRTTAHRLLGALEDEGFLARYG